MVIHVDHMPPMNHNFSFLDYFPRTAYVHQGDVVTFRWSPNANAVHTVTLLPAGVAPTDKALDRLFPGALNGAPDKDDTGGKGISLEVEQKMMPNCGNSLYYPGTGPCVYTGATALNSGLQIPAANVQTGKVNPNVPLPQFVVRMSTAPGIYHWVCLIHGGLMNGTIHVLPLGAALPSLAAQAAVAARQYQYGASRAIQHANGIASHVPGPKISGGHTSWTVQAGGQYGRVEIDEYFPRNVNVKPGDSVTWLPGGFHTITTPQFPNPAFDLSCERPGGQDTPFKGNWGCGVEAGLGPGAFPSGPSGQAWTGQQINSGIVVFPQPRNWTVSYPKAGTFHYVCYIHAAMGGSVTIK